MLNAILRKAGTKMFIKGFSDNPLKQKRVNIDFEERKYTPHSREVLEPLY